jgi:hypothetical protein
MDDELKLIMDAENPDLIVVDPDPPGLRGLEVSFTYPSMDLCSYINTKHR